MIEITTFEYDNEYEVRLKIHANSVDCSSSLTIYCEPLVFKEFAEKLVDFPFENRENVVFEYGEDDNKWAYYCKLEVSVLNSSGGILIIVIMDNKGVSDEHYRCKFPIHTNISTIAELGKKLLMWTPFPGEVCTIENRFKEN